MIRTPAEHRGKRRRRERERPDDVVAMMRRLGSPQPERDAADFMWDLFHAWKRRRFSHPHKKSESAKSKIGLASRRRVGRQRRDAASGRFA